jgi:chromosome partitioning protein
VKVLATYNIKGGVGKTATAVNLAYLAAREGSRTLVWDLDPQGAASFYFRVKPKVKGGARKLIQRKDDLIHHVRGTDHELLDLLPSDFSYRNLDLVLDREKKPTRRLDRLLVSLVKMYDYVFIDCAPGISLVSESIFFASDALLVPTIPTMLSIRTLKQLRKHLKEMDRRRPRLLPFLCMIDRRRVMHREVAATLDGDPDFLEARIPYASAVEKMGRHRAPLATFASRSEASRAYESLWSEIIIRLDEKE